MSFPDALLAAVILHRRSLDKAGEYEVLHPLRMACYAYDLPGLGRAEATAIAEAAALHDTMEDTGATPEVLENMDVDNDTIDAVEVLTKREGEMYFDYIRRVRVHRVPCIVKLIDIIDNLTRIWPPNGIGDLRKRYDRAGNSLLEALAVEHGYTDQPWLLRLKYDLEDALEASKTRRNR